MQVLPTGQGVLGGSSNLNLERVGQTVANAAIASLGDGGGVTLYTLRSAHLLADVAGIDAHDAHRGVGAVMAAGHVA